MIDDFALRLFSSLCKQRDISMIEEDMKIRDQMMHTRLDDVNIEIVLQFCA